MLMSGSEGGVVNGGPVKETVPANATAPAVKEETKPAAKAEKEEPAKQPKEGPCGLPGKCIIL